jgi:hypothetical protein
MFRELDRRISGPDTIALFWDGDRSCGELVIDRDGESRTRLLPLSLVADALRHPYLYLGFPAAGALAPD